MSAYRLDQDDRVWLTDHRFKGYVNDFMVSPRNPITTQKIQEQKPQGTYTLHLPLHLPTRSLDHC